MNSQKLINYLKKIASFRYVEYLIIVFILGSSFIKGGTDQFIFSLFPILMCSYIVIKKKIVLQPGDYLLISFIGFIVIISLFYHGFNYTTLSLIFILIALFILKNILFNQHYFIFLFLTITFIHAIIILLQRIFLNMMRPASTFINPNWTALWFIVAMYFLLFEKNYFRTKIQYFITSIVLLLSGILLTQSRTIIIIILYFLFYLLIKKRLIERRYFIIAVAALIVVIGLLYWRLTVDKADPFAWSRGKIYKADYLMIKEYPLFGVGPGNVEYVLRGYGLGEKTKYTNFSKMPSMAENAFIEIILNFGLIGFIIVVPIVYFLFRKRIYGLPLTFFMIAACVNNVEKSFSLVMLFVLIASFGKHEYTKVFHIKPYYVSMVTFVITYISLGQILSYILYKNNDGSLNSLSAYSNIRAAYKISKYDPFYINEYYDYLSHTQLQFPENKKLVAQERLFNEMKRLSPYDTYFRYKHCYFYWDKIKRLPKNSNEASELRMRLSTELDYILKQWPNNVGYLYFKMQYLHDEGNKDSALEIAYKILTIEPNYYKVHKYLSENALDKQTRNEHIRKMREIYGFDRKNLNDYEQYILSVSEN